MMALRMSPFTLVTLALLLSLMFDVIFAGGMPPNRFTGPSVRFSIGTKLFQIQPDVILDGATASTSRLSSRASTILQKIRGGGSSEEDEDNEDEENNEDGEDDDDGDDDDDSGVSKTKVASGEALGTTQQVVLTITKLATKTSMALNRAFQAIFQSEGNSDGDFVSRILNTVQRILEAIAKSPTESQADAAPVKSTAVGAVVVTPKLDKPWQGTTSNANDFGTYLSQAYAVADGRPTGGTKGSVAFLGGSLADALRIARSQARLLVVFIPASQPPKRSSTAATPDQVAIQSLLSKKAVNAAQKKARKDEHYGSFIFWGAKAGSPDSVAALKRLNVKQIISKGVKKPVLLVAFPKQVISSAGEVKLTPITIAQHHCSPPPLAESMAAWLNTLRKRHKQEYATMHLELQEAKLFQERQVGYRESVITDAQKQETERKMKAERIAKETAEKERFLAIEKRRKELLASLPDEPTTAGANVVTIALRFIDGRTGQRKFASDTPLEAVFNWVDALYEMERETVVLTTMNGQKTFSWKGVGKRSLADAGIGRMTGLRVSQVKADAPSSPEAAAAAVSSTS